MNSLNSVQISTLSLGICPIISFINRQYDFLAFQIAIYITSILNHFKLYPAIRKLDILLVWMGALHHTLVCLPHANHHIYSYILWAIGKSLYPLSLHYGDNRIHAIMHYCYISAFILLNVKGLKRGNILLHK